MICEPLKCVYSPYIKPIKLFPLLTTIKQAENNYFHLLKQRKEKHNFALLFIDMLIYRAECILHKLYRIWHRTIEYDKLYRQDLFIPFMCKGAYRVVCVETGRVYSNPFVVEKDFGFHLGCIRRCCDNGGGYAYGFHWMYLSDWERLNA